MPKDYNVGASREYERGLGALIVMLAPLAPHFASELWAAFVDNASKESATSGFDFVCPFPLLFKKRDIESAFYNVRASR